MSAPLRGGNTGEDVMRYVVLAIGIGALAAGALVQPAAAAKTKMGCEIGKEVWNASIGKCEPGTRKPAKRTSSKAPKKK
jgi:hypothetical protein